MDLQFLEDAPKGSFSVAIQSHEGTILHQLDCLPGNVLSETLPRFVDRAAVCKDGHLEFTFEGPSGAAIVSMLRFAIHGDYTMCEQLQGGTDSMLLHMQLFALAHWFKSDQLATEASQNLKRLLWNATCEPRPLNDLVAAIRFLYTVLDRTPDTEGMREDVAHYVLGQWDYHRLNRYLGLDAAMRQCPRFMQDLSLANVKSNFQLAGAGVVCQRNLEDCRNRDHIRTHGLCDFLCEYHEEHDGVLHYFAEQRRYWEEPYTLPIHNWPRCPTDPPARLSDDGNATPSVVSDTASSFIEPALLTPTSSTWDGRATSVPLSAAFSGIASHLADSDEMEALDGALDVTGRHAHDASDVESDGSYDFIGLRPRDRRTLEVFRAGSTTDFDNGDDDGDDSAVISDASSDFTLV